MGGIAAEQMRRAMGARLPDVYAAIRHLRAMPMIDPQRIAVIGFSDGGRVTLHAAAGMGPDGSAWPETDLPRAAVGFYPVCFGPQGPRAAPRVQRAVRAQFGPEAATAASELKRPFLAHVAGLDDCTGSNEGLCQPTWERLERQNEGRVIIHRYAGVRHTFDDERLTGWRDGPQGTVGHDRAASRLARQRTLEFLQKEAGIEIKKVPVP